MPSATRQKREFLLVTANRVRGLLMHVQLIRNRHFDRHLFHVKPAQHAFHVKQGCSPTDHSLARSYDVEVRSEYIAETSHEGSHTGLAKQSWVEWTHTPSDREAFELGASVRNAYVSAFPQTITEQTALNALVSRETPADRMPNNESRLMKGDK